MRIYDNVTRAIIEEMERGAIPWARPLKADRRGVASVMPADRVHRRRPPDPLGGRKNCDLVGWNP
jgi:antirestriction protein ArdC